MNFRLIIKYLGIVLVTESVCMILPMLVSVINREQDMIAFIVSIMITLLVGFGFYRVKVTINNLYARDGFAIVALAWFLVSLFGSLPFLISGQIPSFINAFFETVSGFTTTGSSILRDIESLPKGILFWRSFTHWMGGMGVLVLTLAVLPSAGASTYYIMQAESPGPTPSKLVPKIGQTAKILYAIYIMLTILQVILLLVAGMPLYDAFIHTFGTAGTGGFSNMNLSVGAYHNVFIDVIITVFMIIFGANFALYYQAYKGGIKSILRDEEFRFYTGTILVSSLLIAFNTLGPAFSSIWESLRYAFFQVGSIITTTGFATADFNLWPVFSKAILVLLMFIGASAGSTGGAMKCIRIVVLFKIIKREIIKIIHPRSVNPVKIGGKVIEEGILSGIMAFFFLYIALFIVSVLLVALEGKDLVTTFTAVAATIGNIGPGLEIVGPMGNYADFSTFSKFVLSMDMIFGRLEFFPVLVLFTPTFWKRVHI